MILGTTLSQIRSIGAIFVAGVINASAAITLSGNFSPSEPFWSNGGDLSTQVAIGNTGAGSLVVDLGSTLETARADIGKSSSGTSSAMVTGIGSAWTVDGLLVVGSNPDGILKILDGAATNVVRTIVATGEVEVGGQGTVWNNTSGISIGSTKSTGGEVSFTGGATATSGGGITVGNEVNTQGILEISGEDTRWEHSGQILAGDRGLGILEISDGGKLYSEFGTCTIGRFNGAIGKIIVSGEDSRFEISDGTIILGSSGTGGMEILEGAEVICSSAIMGSGHTGGGSLTIGSGSTLTITNGELGIADIGNGNLRIAENGQVRVAESIRIKRASTGFAQITFFVSGDGMLAAGTGSAETGSFIDSGAFLYLYAGANLAPGTYFPITTGVSGGAISGVFGPVRATGGSWDPSVFGFTVLPTLPGQGGLNNTDVSGRRVSFDNERILIGFDQNAGTANVSAVPVNLNTIDGDAVIAAYDVSLTQSTNRSASLSIYIGPGYSRAGLSVLRQGIGGFGNWANLSNSRAFSYADGFITFPGENSSSRYAVTTTDRLRPHIVVESTDGEELPDNSSLIDFGPVAVGDFVERTLTVRNEGYGFLNVYNLSVSASETSGVTVTNPLPSTISPLSSSMITFRFAPPFTGNVAGEIVIESNDPQIFRDHYEVAYQGVGATPEDLFTMEITSVGLTGADAEPTAVPFEDGTPNLLKYAFNMNLGGADITTLEPGGNKGLPTTGLVEVEGETFFRVEYLRRKGSGLVYEPQKSTTLGSFVPLTGAATIMSIDSEWERVTVDEPCTPATADQCFSRVRVEIP